MCMLYQSTDTCLPANANLVVLMLQVRGGGLEDVACEAEIIECQPQPDGCVVTRNVLCSESSFFGRRRQNKKQLGQC